MDLFLEVTPEKKQSVWRRRAVSTLSAVANPPTHSNCLKLTKACDKNQKKSHITNVGPWFYKKQASMSETHNQQKAWHSSIQPTLSTKKETWVLVRTKTGICQYLPTSKTVLIKTTWLVKAKAFQIELLTTYIQTPVKFLANMVSINWNKRLLLSPET